MLKAAIDLGTNTCLLLVVEVDAQGKWVRTVEDQAQVVRLGKGIGTEKKGQFASDAMERTLSCLKEFSEVLRRLSIEPPMAVCAITASARSVDHPEEFLSTIQVETGLRFEVLSGSDEARLTFFGTLSGGGDREKSAVIDIGGGSTELMAPRLGQSLDIGSVRLTEQFLKTDPVTDEEFWSCRAAIDDAVLSMVAWRETLPSGTQLIGVAGTVTTLACWFLKLDVFDPQKLDGLELSRGEIHRLVEELKWRTVPERKAEIGIDENRADVLLAGAMILWRSMEILNFSQVRVSTRGLRYGLLDL